MTVVKPQSYPRVSAPSTVVNPFLSRSLNSAASRGLPQFFFAPEGDPDPAPNPSIKEQVRQAVSEIIAKHDGDKESALETLIRRNHKLELRAEKAETERDELKGKLPDEKEQGAQAEELAKWRELGESPEKVSALIADGAQAVKDAAGLKRERSVNEAAGILKLKPSALSAKWLGEGVPIVKTVGEGDKAQQQVFIKDGDKETAWEDFVKANGELADVLPALKVEAVPNGTPMPRQHSGGTDPKLTNEEEARRGQSGLYAPNNL